MTYLTGLAGTAARVFPYTNEAYSTEYQHEYVAKFCHDSLAVGATHPECGREIVSSLNSLAASVADNIAFISESVTDQLSGGACTSISLRVAKETIRKMAEISTEADLSKKSKDIALINAVRRIVEKANKEAQSERPKYKEVRQQTRTVQQAFNTISVVDRSKNVENIVQEKIRAMAAYYKLSACQSTPEINVRSKDLLKELCNCLESLKPGIYLIRIIKYQKNHKLEKHGHTAVYIKTVKMTLYFDVALGLYTLFNESKKHLIHDAMLSAKKRFDVDSLSFHKLKEMEASFAKKLRIYTIEALKPLAAAPAASFLFPSLSGIYAVGFRRYCIEDASRNERQLGHEMDISRRIEIDVHYPAVQNSAAALKSPALLKNGQIVDVAISTHSKLDLECFSGKKFPIVIFSPGLGATPDDYQHYIEELASHGFCVISINHPFSSLYTRYLGTSQVPLNKLKEEQIIAEGLIRAKDIEFLIDQIQNGQIEGFHEIFKNSINIDSIGTIGHSLGGSAAVEASRLTSAVQAAIDLDGRIIEQAHAKPATQPILLITAELENNREEFEKAFLSFQKQNPQISRKNIPARHSDFSLAQFYRLRGLKPLTQQYFKTTNDVNRTILSFFKENLGEAQS